MEYYGVNMEFFIHKLSDNKSIQEKIKEFLFSQIKSEYGYGYVPEYHEDIINMENFYLNSCNSELFYIMDDENKIIATIAIRPYDKNFKEFNGIYDSKSTASIWRLFVDPKFRRHGLATKLFNIVEDFCYVNNYNEIYLHTHKNLKGGFSFWQAMDFEITLDTNNELQTVHMVKNIPKLNDSNLINSSSEKRVLV